MRLGIVIPVLNQFDLSRTAIDFAVNYLDKPADVIVLDNGSDEAFEYKTKVTPTQVNEDGVNEPTEVKVIRLEKNIGVYPTFWEVLKHTDADVLAFFHSDLILGEKGWDTRVLAEFEKNPKLGLIGFIGSNEIDSSGGRGAGTTSNFQGNKMVRHLEDGTTKEWSGSPAEAHGQRNAGYTNAAVVDGCAMIFRREVLEQIEQRMDWPVHHHYDRLLSCEIQELGFEVGVLGIGCDHISGQTANQEDSYSRMAEQWANNNLGVTTYQDWVDKNLDWFHNVSNPSREKIPHNWDSVIYMESEKRFLAEYREQKKFIPIKL